jgi:uncharacterized membrane protein
MKIESSSPYAQATVFTGLVAVFSFLILLMRHGLKFQITTNLIPLFILLTIITALGMIFTFKGFKHIEASEHTILLTSSRIWAILGAVVLLNEVLDMQKLLGALLIITGVVITQWKKKEISISKGSVYVLLAAFFFASSEILSYFILRNFDAIFFLMITSGMISFSLFMVKPGIIKEIPFYFRPRRAFNVLFSAFNDTLANLFGFIAYQIGRNALQLAPLGATQVIVTVIMALIILKERERLLQKLVGAVIAGMGTFLLI